MNEYERPRASPLEVYEETLKLPRGTIFTSTLRIIVYTLIATMVYYYFGTTCRIPVVPRAQNAQNDCVPDLDLLRYGWHVPVCVNFTSYLYNQIYLGIRDE